MKFFKKSISTVLVSLVGFSICSPAFAEYQYDTIPSPGSHYPNSPIRPDYNYDDYNNDDFDGGKKGGGLSTLETVGIAVGTFGLGYLLGDSAGARRTEKKYADYANQVPQSSSHNQQGQAIESFTVNTDNCHQTAVDIFCQVVP
jgi:hypothetical protein